MKVTEKQRLSLQRMIKKWKHRLFLGEWFVFAAYGEGDESESGAIATSSPNPTYMQCTITVYESFWRKYKADQEHIIVHELCHCITEPAYRAQIDLLNFKMVTNDHINEIRERTTQRIANIAFQQEWRK